MTPISGHDASIVIPTHTERRWDSLLRTVASAQAQHWPAQHWPAQHWPAQHGRPAEVIVVVDHNPAMFARVKDELPGVTVLPNKFARGASGTRNTGAFHSRTPLIAFLDDDTVADSAWLGNLMVPFADPDVVGAGGGIIPAWADSRPRWLPDELLWTVGVSYTGMPTALSEIRNVWSAGMMVRRAVFMAVGGFRAGFGKVGEQNRPEDTELCLRMSAERGGRWMYVPDAQIEHEVPLDRSTFRFFLRRCYAEGRGKVQMAGLLPGAHKLDTEREYLRRTLPRAVARNLAAAGSGRGVAFALRAATVVAGVAAAGLGGGVETIAARGVAGGPA